MKLNNNIVLLKIKLNNNKQYRYRNNIILIIYMNSII